MLRLIYADLSESSGAIGQLDSDKSGSVSYLANQEMKG
jgi:hypothetical protein